MKLLEKKKLAYAGWRVTWLGYHVVSASWVNIGELWLRQVMVTLPWAWFSRQDGSKPSHGKVLLDVLLRPTLIKP
jgi:hypothetical protein